MDTMTKHCKRCDRNLPHSAFWKDSGSKDLLQNNCKDCKKEQTALYRKRDPEGFRQNKVNYRKRHPDRIKDEHFKYHYGITVAERDAMLAAQDGKCAICGTTDGEWHVDHDHSCCAGSKTCGNCLRGILCGHCNKAMGLFKDNVKSLKAAIRYLESGA